MESTMTQTNRPNTLADAIVVELEQSLQGRVLRPRHPDYDEARRVWNGMIDRHPALIIQVETVADVVAGVNFARDHDLLLSVRGGGHNVAGHATNDGGLVIDLGRVNQVSVDPAARVVRAGGGATIGDLDRATQEHGLVVPMGVVSATGIAGLTLGGGLGFLRNKWGTSSDNLIGAEVVTAGGRVLRASAAENADLFWGLRGGGGNFGIVTEFVYRAHALGPEVFFTAAFYHGDEGESILRRYRDFVAAAPDEISTIAFLGQFPPVEEVPEALQGLPFATIVGMYAGPAADGAAAMAPLREFGEPLLDESGVMPYVQAQTFFDADYSDGLRYYWKSLNLTRLDDAAIAMIVERARQQPSPFSTTDLWHIGDGMRRFGAEDSAFQGRGAAFLLNPEANWIDPADDEANLHWVRSFVGDLAPYSDGSRYLNFPGFQEEGDEMMRSSFGDRYRRLAELKAKYDPDNLFRLNQNIKPEAAVVG